MILSSGQTDAVDAIMRWYKSDEKRFVLAGYAGAGKTTLAKHIASLIGENDVIFCAFTGKAANVLRDKGCANAGTIHKFVYILVDHNREELARLNDMFRDAVRLGNRLDAEALAAEIKNLRAKYLKPKFELNDGSYDEDGEYEKRIIDAKLVIVDEYSMLSEKTIFDLETLAHKVLYLGDPFQLPPIEGKCLLEPQYFVSEIHRQALDNPIIRYSKMVREGDKFGYCDEGAFKFIPRHKAAPEIFTSADQVIVGKNKTRHAWNFRFRQLKGFEKLPLPQDGEKMICLKNNPEMGLFNGSIGYCHSSFQEQGQDFKFEMGFDDLHGLQVWLGDIRGESDKYDGYDFKMRALQRFDYGYAITCHKSQGSEFGKLTVYNEPIGKGIERRRWLYTAITRARESCTLVDAP